MADYKRVVSYIYLYNHQLKGSNVGFARVETKNNQCKFTIHVRVPSIIDEVIKAYIYCWYGKRMHGVLLGEVHIKNGTGDFNLVTDALNLCNTQYKLSEMSGIVLYVSDTQFLGTEWDDRPIVFDTLDVDVEKPEEMHVRRPYEQEESTEQVASSEEQTLVVEHEPKEAEPENSFAPIWKEGTTWEQICEDQQSRMAKNLESEFILPSKEIERLQEEEQLQAAEVTKENYNGEPEKEAVPESEQSEEAQLEEEPLEAEPVQEEPAEEKLAEPTEAGQPEEEQPGGQGDSSFPLNAQQMASLDERAQDLFGTIMNTNAFQTPEFDDMVKTMNSAASSFVVSPKSAIECFTAFKSCESQQEYEEIQSEIETLKAEITHLERVSKEWLIKLSRIREEQEAREYEKGHLEAKLRESFHIDTDVYREEEGEDLIQQSIAMAPEATTLKTSDVVKRIFAKYPRMEPFPEDSKVEYCVRIEPQDIGIFPMENWILANNSFLLHGYYSYRHLIFAMYNNNGEAEFFLGVPGIHYSRESFMAKMFGFNMFRPIIQEEQTGQSEEFGYWCMPIHMPL